MTEFTDTLMQFKLTKDLNKTRFYLNTDFVVNQ